MIDILSSSVTLMVGELDDSVAFYVQKLGFAIEYQAAPHFAMLQRAGLRLGLHPRGSSQGAGECRGVSIGLEVADIGASVAALEASGVAFPDGVVEDGTLLRADFFDPDGTALYLVQLPDRRP